MISLHLSLGLQEKVLLWLLQFMQEQAISLDEVDQNGNTAVHVAAQYGHLTCIQVRHSAHASPCAAQPRPTLNFNSLPAALIPAPVN